MIILDTETEGLRWWDGHKPVAIAVAWKEGGEWKRRYLPFAHRGGGNLDRETVFRWFRTELKNKIIVGHNIKFDHHMLLGVGLDLEAQGCRLYDTQHLMALLDDHRRHGFSLEALTVDILGEPEGKLKRTAYTNAPLRMDRIAEYHAGEIAAYGERDVELTGRLYDTFMPRIVEEDLVQVLEIESRAIWPTCYIERHPPKLDWKKLAAWEQDTRVKVECSRQLIRDELGFIFEPTHKGWSRLFRDARISLPRDITKGGKTSFQSGTLEDIDHPLVHEGLRVQHYESMRSKFLLAYPVKADHERLRSSFHQLRADEGGTITGRYSSSGYKVDGGQVGANLQQVYGGGRRTAKYAAIVRDFYPIRELFIPDSGLWCSADAAQIEYRIMSHYANSEEIDAVYRENPNASFHKIVRKMVEEKQPIEYDNLKALNFSMIYGAGIYKVAEMMKMTKVQAQELWDMYHDRFPEPGILFKKAMKVARNRGYVKTFYGRRGRFPTIDKFGKTINEKMRRLHKALNTIIQGTAADIMKIKMCEVHEERDNIHCTMRLTNHDELGGDVPDEESADRLTEVLNRQTTPLRIPILWEVGTGPNWMAAKDQGKKK